MANPARNAANVLVGAPDVKAAGGLAIGKVATDTSKYPTNALKALDTTLGMVPAGYIGPDGISKTVDRTTEKIKDWNGDTIKVITSEHSVTLKLKFMEAGSAVVLKTVYGANNVTGEDKSIKAVDNATDLPHFSLAAQLKSSTNRTIRLFAGDCQVTEVGDVNYVKNDVISYDVTIECYVDADDNKLYQFIDEVGQGGKVEFIPSTTGEAA